MRPIHENDIRWLLDGSAAAALGEKSGFQSFLAQMLGGGGGGNQADVAEAAELRTIEAVQRARRVKDVLERCGKEHQRVLHEWARADKLAPYWGTLTHVLPLCPTFDAEKHGGRRGETRDLRLTLGNADETQKAAALKLRRWAETAVASALAEYTAIFDAAAEKGRAA